MRAFLAPTRRKIAWTLLGLLVLPACALLRAIPAPWDLLDLRELGGLVLRLLLGVPIRILDAATGSAFAVRSEGFLAFPSATQLAFALGVDLLLFYAVACALSALSSRRHAGGDNRGQRRA